MEYGSDEEKRIFAKMLQRQAQDRRGPQTQQWLQDMPKDSPPPMLETEMSNQTTVVDLAEKMQVLVVDGSEGWREREAQEVQGKQSRPDFYSLGIVPRPVSSPSSYNSFLSSEKTLPKVLYRVTNPDMYTATVGTDDVSAISPAIAVRAPNRHPYIKNPEHPGLRWDPRIPDWRNQKVIECHLEFPSRVGANNENPPLIKATPFIALYSTLRAARKLAQRLKDKGKTGTSIMAVTTRHLQGFEAEDLMHDGTCLSPNLPLWINPAR
ncbi:hypothetical protein SEUCBS139899_001981 [Sporothrix eucalyptigena]